MPLPVSFFRAGKRRSRSGAKRGGWNVEFLLSLTLASNGHPAIYALAGMRAALTARTTSRVLTPTPKTLARARQLGLDPAVALANNDAHGFFERLGDNVIAGSRYTNIRTSAPC